MKKDSEFLIRNVTRRGFLSAGLGLLGSTLLSRSGLEAFAVVDETPQPADILKRAIPSSGEKIPVLGLGTWKTFNTSLGSEQYGRIRDVLRLFSKSGGTVVDTASIYGRSESNIGTLAAELNIHDRFFYATKVWAWGGLFDDKQIKSSYDDLRVETMDLYQVHNLINLDTQLKKLRALKDEGRVRYVGVTHWQVGAHEDLIRVLNNEKLDFIQFNHNIRVRNAEKKLLPLAQDRGVATLINQPFGGGDLFHHVQGKQLPPWAAEFGITAWSQFFLKYLLSFPGVTCPIPATSNPAHLIENMQAAYGPLPDKKTREKMAALFS